MSNELLSTEDSRNQSVEPKKKRQPPAATLREVFDRVALTPEERTLIRKASNNFVFPMIASLPFVFWMTRTLTLPSNVYYPTFLRGTLMKFRPWKSVSLVQSFVINFFVIYAVVSAIQFRSLNYQSKMLLSLDTDLGREVRAHLAAYRPEYYERYVPEEYKRKDKEEAREMV